jgi:hypothetical protein
MLYGFAEENCWFAIAHCMLYLYILILQCKMADRQFALCSWRYMLVKYLAIRKNIKVSIFYTERKPFPPLQSYGGTMLVILEDSSMTHKVTEVRTNVHSMSCWFCYVICCTIDSVCRVTGARVCWFLTKRSGWPLFRVKISIVETDRVHAKMLITKQKCRKLQWLYSWQLVSRTRDGWIGKLRQTARFTVVWFQVLSAVLVIVRLLWDVMQFQMFWRVLKIKQFCWSTSTLCQTLHLNRWYSINVMWLQISSRQLHKKITIFGLFLKEQVDTALNKYKIIPLLCSLKYICHSILSFPLV